MQEAGLTDIMAVPGVARAFLSSRMALSMAGVNFGCSGRGGEVGLTDWGLPILLPVLEGDLLPRLEPRLEDERISGSF